MSDVNLKSLLPISVSVLGRDRQGKQTLGQSRTRSAWDYLLGMGILQQRSPQTRDSVA